MQFSTSRLRVKGGVQQPSILLFDDSLSRDWHAYRSGHPLPIMRANAHFMAVSLTPGNADVEFRFEPATFNLLLKVTVATAAFLLAACIWYFIGARQGMRHLHKSESSAL